MNTVNKVLSTIQAEYKKNLTKKTMLLDGLVVYSICTGAIQLAYMILVGNFPFNSFLSSFICHVGLFAISISLRLQLTSTSEFKGITPERAFGDFALCVLVLLFVVYSFLG